MQLKSRGRLVAPIVKIVRQSAALPAAQRRLLILAFILVAGVRTVLWLLPSRISLRLARRLEEVAAHSRADARPTVDGIAWAIDAASRRVPRASCLTQAIAAQLLLRLYGYDSRLCLGVARSATGEFSAHAWLERDGRIIIGGTESAAFARMPALRSTIPGRSGVHMS